MQQYFCGMNKWLIVLSVIIIASCVSEVKKTEAEIQPYEKFFGAQPVVDSIPDAVVVKMHSFAVKYPNHDKSEKYLYMASVVTEARGNRFECAKWSAEFAELYPKSKDLQKALVAAAENYEKSGSFDKAIEYFEKAAANTKNTEEGEQYRKMARMLKMGLVTPEQQFQYIMQQKDSAAKLNAAP